MDGPQRFLELFFFRHMGSAVTDTLCRTKTPVWNSMPPDNAAELYKRISEDPELTNALFKQALQDPSGALGRIVEIGAAQGLPVDPEDVKAHIASLDDGATKQWLIKARGGL